MNISEVAKTVDLPVKTIRYYADIVVMRLVIGNMMIHLCAN